MIKKLFLFVAVTASLLVGGNLVSNHHAYAASQVTCPDGKVVDDGGVSCGGCQPKQNFLGLKTWYAYLPGKVNAKGGCDPQLNCSAADANGTCYKQEDGNIIDPGKILLIVMAVLETLLRLAGLIAFFMVIYGGIKYVLSQGQPDATKSARGTIINSMIGLVITILAGVGVNFIAKLLQ